MLPLRGDLGKKKGISPFLGQTIKNKMRRMMKERAKLSLPDNYHHKRKKGSLKKKKKKPSATVFKKSWGQRLDRSAPQIRKTDI